MHAANEAHKELYEHPDQRHVFDQLEEDVNEFAQSLFDDIVGIVGQNPSPNYFYNQNALLEAMAWVNTQINMALQEAIYLTAQNQGSSEDFYSVCLDIVEFAEIYILLEELGGYTSPSQHELKEQLFFYYLGRALDLHAVLRARVLNVFSRLFFT
ncbi:MAG TPA: hypothetical protein DIU37_05555 [Opitutae bacterium]|nr:hypothetical protein [Opitutae bacterium]